MKSDSILSVETDFVSQLSWALSKKGFFPKMEENLSWTEKYRPQRVEDLVSQEKVSSLLLESLEKKTIPHLLFYGPPGVGKTSAVLALSRQMFGTKFRDNILELNASDERGIGVIRSKVKKFAQYTTGEKYSVKIVILDEADSMTSDAQSALRRVMEKYSKETRFCILCNYVSKIIPAIISRCAKFRFKPIPMDLVLKRLREIATLESVNIREDALEAICEVSGGDMRRAITTLEMANSSSTGGAIETSDVYEITGKIPQEVIDSLINVCRRGDWTEVMREAERIVKESFSVFGVIRDIIELVASDESKKFDDRQKSLICKKACECEGFLLQKADKFLQLLDLTAEMKTVLSKD